MKLTNFRDLGIFVQRNLFRRNFKLHNIRSIHVEITDRCNAACPMCARNINGGPDNPHLKNLEITLDDFKKAFSPTFLKQLRRVYFCGNYGDPAISRDLIEIMEYIRKSAPNVILGMNSNAGVGSADRWKRLGEILSQKGDYCCFSLDGLEDTNHIYRRNVKWSHAMRSAEAFIAAGGKARWEFIVFKHNEHQINEARELSKKMGFERFNLKDTGRFYVIHDDVKVHSFPVYNKNLEFEYYLEPATDEKERFQNIGLYQNIDQKEMNARLKTHLMHADYLNKKIGLDDSYHSDRNAENNLTTDANINCKAMHEKSIFLSSDGHVYPCCWTAYPINSLWNNNESRQLRELIQQCGGMDSISIHKNSIQSIVEGAFFKSITSSWNKPCAKEGKLISCSIHCGTHLEKERRLTPQTAARENSNRLVK